MYARAVLTGAEIGPRPHGAGRTKRRVSEGEEGKAGLAAT